MSRALPPAASAIGQLLVDTAGGYLHNAVRESGVTCLVCSAPVGAGYTRCMQCRNYLDESRVADRVAAVVYAPFRTQAYTLMRGYKGAVPGPSHTAIMKMLLGLALRGHVECVMKLGGGQPLRWAVVPSIGPREGEHPLHAIVASLTVQPSLEVVLRAAPAVTEARSFSPEHFVVEGPVAGHVMLLDDSWVTGAHAQSAAGALKAAGASEVSILVAARVLNPDWGPNPDFIRARLTADFDPAICPWSGSTCPD